MRVEVHLLEQATPCTFEDVRNVYTKGKLLCVMCDGGRVIYKFPIRHIFRVKEEGGPAFIPPKKEGKKQ